MHPNPPFARTAAPAPCPAIPNGVWLAAALYVLAWSVLPALLAQSFPLDVVESLTWGREWQWGTYKHPPLAPALLHLFWLAFGKVGPYLLSQLCIAATLWGVWCMGLRLMSRQRAFVGTALTMGVFFYTYPALEFNHNIAQMPVWAALGWCLLAALQGQPAARLRYWLLLGVLAGVGMLAKYSIAVLLACMGMYLVLSPARRMLRQPGPWLALLVSLVVFAPHLFWLWHSDWLPLTYASNRAASNGAHQPRLEALQFVGTQALNHLPMAVIVLLATLGARSALRRSPSPAQPLPAPGLLHTPWPGYLLVLALGPGLVITLLGLLGGLRLHDMWGAPIWAFSGLVVAAALPAHGLAPMRRYVLLGLACWLALISLLSGAYLAYGAQWRHRPARTDWPAQVLGAQVEASWRSLSRCPLSVVAGPYWLAGLASVASADRPSVLIDGDPRFSPWVTRERLRSQGALWIGQDAPSQQNSPLLARLTPSADLQWHEGVWRIAWHYDAAAAPLTVHWRAYVPERCAR